MSRFVFEKLFSPELDKVYYVIFQKDKGITIYTQDEEVQTRLLSAENVAAEFFKVYTSLRKATREELPERLLEWKIPCRSMGIGFNWEQYETEKRRRRLAGEKIQIRLSR